MSIFLDLDADVFGLEEFVDAIEAAFATETALLNSAEWRCWI